VHFVDLFLSSLLKIHGPRNKINLEDALAVIKILQEKPVSL